jgi:hypothetical protein
MQSWQQRVRNHPGSLIFYNHCDVASLLERANLGKGSAFGELAKIVDITRTAQVVKYTSAPSGSAMRIAQAAYISLVVIIDSTM